MKKIVHILLLLIISGTFFTGCEEIEVSFAKMTNDPDPNATYYLQFMSPQQSFETSVTESGGLIDIETTIDVGIMGMPQSEDITVNLSVSSSSSLTSSMYDLSGTSITIPAGETSGSLDFTAIAANMPVDETLHFIMTLNNGEHNSPNTNGTTLDFSVKRIKFCPLENGVADLAGTWTATDVGYDWGSYLPTEVSVGVTGEVDGTSLRVYGIGEAFIWEFWGEEVVSGGSFLMTVAGNGTVDIPRQYIYTTVYGGANYDYEIKGSGKWENCGATPKITFTYDIYYVGDSDGLAKTYASYMNGIPYLTAVMTMDAGKGTAPANVFTLGKVPFK